MMDGPHRSSCSAISLAGTRSSAQEGGSGRPARAGAGRAGGVLLSPPAACWPARRRAWIQPGLLPGGAPGGPPAALLRLLVDPRERVRRRLRGRHGLRGCEYPQAAGRRLPHPGRRASAELAARVSVFLGYAVWTLFGVVAVADPGPGFDLAGAWSSVVSLTVLRMLPVALGVWARGYGGRRWSSSAGSAAWLASVVRAAGGSVDDGQPAGADHRGDRHDLVLLERRPARGHGRPWAR